MLVYQSKVGHIVVIGGAASHTVIQRMLESSGITFYRVDCTNIVGYEGELTASYPDDEVKE